MLGLITPRVLLMNNSFEYLDYSLVSFEAPCPCLLLYYMEVTSHLLPGGPYSHQGLVLSKLLHVEEPAKPPHNCINMQHQENKARQEFAKLSEVLRQEMHAPSQNFTCK